MNFIIKSVFSVIVYFLFSKMVFAFPDSDSIIVYSVSGKVNLSVGKKIMLIKSNDILSDNSVLILDPNSKFIYIDKNKKIFLFDKLGRYKVKDILGNRKAVASEYGKAMEMVIHHFIEHGKSISDRKTYSRVGASFRGDDDKWILFPSNELKILHNTVLIPQINLKILDVKNEITAHLIKNDEIIHIYNFKPGESISLGQDFEKEAEYFLRFTAGQHTSVTEIKIAQQDEVKNLESDLANLRQSFYKISISAYLLSEALYFQSKHFQIDAMQDFDKLLEMDPSNEYYKSLLNSSVEGINVN